MNRTDKAKEYIEELNLTTRSRQKYFTERRQIVCHVLREERLTLSEIGKIIKRDHATVLWNLRQYDNNIKYPDYQALKDCVYLEGSLHKEKQPDKIRTLTEKVLLCENYWQMVKLQNELKEEIKLKEKYGNQE